MSTADKLNALVQTKADIKQALIDKGQNPSDVFSTYADDIRAIESGLRVDIPKDTGFAYSTWIDFPEEIREHINNPENFTKGKDMNGRLLQNTTTTECTKTELYFAPVNMSYLLKNASFYYPNIPDTTEITFIFDNKNNADVFGEGTQIYEAVSGLFINIEKYGLAMKQTYKFQNCSNVVRYILPDLKGGSYLRILGIDFTSVASNGSSFESSWLGYLEVTNLGKHPDCTVCSAFSQLSRWGNSDDVWTGCKKSLTDSLIVNSFDRASAGYPTCTLTLGTYTKTYLTEDEIAQITAKGFTIA